MQEITAEQAKDQLRTEAVNNPADPDYDGLHQGRDGTKLRHDTIRQVIAGFDIDRLLDVGCGTGLFLQSAAEAGMKLPGYYVGVDFLEERRQHVEARLAKYDVPGEFLTEIPDLPQGERWDVIIAIGIMGYPGLHSLDLIERKVSDLRLVAKHGAITIPRQMPERLGEAEMARYATEDVIRALGSYKFSYLPIHTDTVVYW